MTEALRVRDLMRPSLITCPPTTSLDAAAALLARHQVRAIVVADRTGMQLGVVTDVDLLAQAGLSGAEAERATLRARTAEAIMRTPVPTIDADALIAEAAARMWTESLDRLVVTEHERGIGLLSLSDLVQVLIPTRVGQRTVGEVMSRGLVVCRAETPVSAAARAMTERRSRALIVVEPNGRPLGLVTGFDLLPAVLSGEGAAPVSAHMHAPVTIGPSATLRQALDTMLAHGLHRLIVIDPALPEGVPLGLLSTMDLVGELAAPGSAW